jgi:hypothetical protein
METPYRVPTAAEYVEALKDISLSEGQRKMLRYHYRAHNRTVTYTELAEAAGYDSYGAANLHYGKLGAALGERLKMAFAPLNAGDPDTPFYSSALGTSKKYDGVEHMLIMHHELAKAIEALGWFN